MKKYLLLTTAVVFMSSNVRATEYVPCGSESNCWPCGTACSARLDDKGTLTFSGEGRMNSYDSTRKEPWSRQDIAPQIKKVVIEDDITHIGGQFFVYGQYTNLTEVNLPESLEGIDWAAFFSAPNLTAVIVPQNTKPASNAFDGFNGMVFCAEGKESSCLQRTDNRGNAKIGTYKTNEDGTREYWYDENGLRGYYDAKGGLLKSVAKKDDGSVYTYNKDGKLTSIRGKKIYTVEEAEAVTAHGDKFHVGLTYK